MKNHWPTKKLGEISRIFSGSSAPQDKKYFENGKYPFVRVFDLATPRSGTELVETRDYVNELAIMELSLVEAQKGAIVFPKSGASILNNNRAMLGTNAYVVSHLSAIEVNENLAVKNWVYYFLSKFDMGKLVSDPGYPSLNISAIEKIKIPLPPLEIQKQIVERLDKIAEAQKLNDGLIQKTDELFQSLLHKEFHPVRDSKNSNGVNPDGKDWEIKKLGDIAETSSGGTPLKEKSEFYENGTIPWLRSGEVSQGLIYKSELCITEKGLKQSSAKIFPIDTVLVAMYGATAGKIGLLKFEASTNQAICGIFPNKKFISEYLYYFLKTKTEYLIQISTGGAQPNISQTVIRNLKIPLPPLEVQKQIAAKLSAVQDYKKQLIAKRTKLKELFDSVLHKSMKNE